MIQNNYLKMLHINIVSMFILFISCTELKAMKGELPPIKEDLQNQTLNQKLLSYTLGSGSLEKVPLTPLEFDFDCFYLKNRDYYLINGKKFASTDTDLFSILNIIVGIMETRLTEVNKFSVWIKDKKYYYLKINAYKSCIKNITTLWTEIGTHFSNYDIAFRCSFYARMLNLYEKIHYMMTLVTQECITNYKELKNMLVPYTLIDEFAQSKVQEYVNYSFTLQQIDVSEWFIRMRAFEKACLNWQ